MKKKVGVLFGGSSVEHEISIITALQAIENLDKSKYEMFPIYITKTGTWNYDVSFLNIDTFKEIEKINYKKTAIDVIRKSDKIFIKKQTAKFNSLITELDMFLVFTHGTNVEDGKLQGFLETLNIPYTGPTVTSGVLGQDKAIQKDILKAHAIDQVEYLWFYKSDDIDDVVKSVINTLGEKVIIKPALLGSSIGIEVSKSEEELKTKIEESFSYCHKIVVEKFLPEFRELNISIVGNYEKQEASILEEVNKSEDLLSYEDKYMNNSKGSTGGMASLDRIIPAKIEEEVAREIKDIAIKSYQALNCESVVRFDMIIYEGQIYVNEVNNIPGSLSFYLWEKSGYEYSKLLDKLIEIAIKSYFDKQKIKFSVNTNVLNIQGTKGQKT